MAVTTREAQLGTSFVRLADSLVSGLDVLDLLQDLVDECKRVLDVDEAGIVLGEGVVGLKVVASTSEKCRIVEEHQLTTGEGPCIDAYTSGAVVTIDDIEKGKKWPLFRDKALEAGFHSLHAIPLRLRADTIGALNLFSADPGALTQNDAVVGQALADVATIAIIQNRIIDQNEIVRTQLQGALDSRVLIEQAKGVVAQSRQVTMDEAFSRLRTYARSNGTILREVAEKIVARQLEV